MNLSRPRKRCSRADEAVEAVVADVPAYEAALLLLGVLAEQQPLPDVPEGVLALAAVAGQGGLDRAGVAAAQALEHLPAVLVGAAGEVLPDLGLAEEPGQLADGDDLGLDDGVPRREILALEEGEAAVAPADLQIDRSA